MQKHNSQFDRPRVETVLGMDGRAGVAALLGKNRRRRRRAIISIADSNRQVGGEYDCAAGGGVGDGPTGDGGEFQGKNCPRAGWRKSIMYSYICHKKKNTCCTHQQKFIRSVFGSPSHEFHQERAAERIDPIVVQRKRAGSRTST